jgi:phosphoribosylanthranilate isomerase
MSLKTFVKVGHISNLSDARYCAGMGVNLIGFNFDGEDSLSLETFREISGWLSGVEYVAEFSGTNTEGMISLLKDSEIDYVQVSDPILISPLTHYKPVILTCDIHKLSSLPDTLDIDYLIIEGNESYPFTHNIRELINSLGRCHKILLSTGIAPDNVETIQEELTIHGIAMKGSNEIRPGYKDYDELADILEILEEE